MAGTFWQEATADASHRIASPKPTQSERNSWLPQSQLTYHSLRLRRWKSSSLKDCQRLCRERGLWPGGDLGRLRQRLLRYDCHRPSLSALDLLGERDRGFSGAISSRVVALPSVAIPIATR